MGDVGDDDISTEFTVVSTAGGTLGVIFEPLAHVLQVAPVGAALAPGEHAADGHVTDGTVRRLEAALLAGGARSDLLHAFGTVHEDGRPRLVDRLNVCLRRELNQPTGDAPQLEAIEEVNVGAVPDVHRHPVDGGQLLQSF